MKQTNKKKGFTIVELVIVIAVIGILSAVLIPTFSGLINKANKTALQEGLTNAYTSYAADWEYSANGDTLLSKEDVYFVAKGTSVSADLADADLGTETGKTTVYYFSGTEYTALTTLGGKKLVKISPKDTTLTDFNGYDAYKLVANA